MSLVFNDTTTKRGIIQAIERRIFPNDAGRISGNATLLAEWTAEVNLALDKALALIFEVCGTWNFDDSGHTKYPIITTNLVAGQRDYTFLTDQQGNLVLDIHRVLVKTEDGIYIDMTPVDVQSDHRTWGFTDGRDQQGTPDEYDKTANGIFLDRIPSYSADDGLKVYINREASYFLTTDTTKKPGFAGLFHEYLAIEPSAKYAGIHTLKNADRLERELLKIEKAMRGYFARRERDTRRVIKPRITRFI